MTLLAGVSDGQDPLAQADSVAGAMELRPGMRVLDLGCGRAASSIFLANRFGVRVWAADRDVSPTENLATVRNAGREEAVFPVRADARDLPFAHDYFDAVIAIDSYYYFGTDERFLPYLVRFLKRGGYIGIADIAFSREIASAAEAPAFLRPTFARHWSFVHSIGWWRRKWEKTGLVDVVAAEPIPESRALLREYVADRAMADRRDEIARAAAMDREGLLELFRLVARKR